MKMMTLKKSIVKRVAMITALCSFFSLYPNIDDKAHIDSLNIAATFIHNIDKQFVSLVDTNIKASLTTCLIAIHKILQDLKQKGEAINRSNDKINVELHNLFEYVIIRFNIAYEILTRYNGKPDLSFQLSQEMKREFNTEEIFSEILKRLKTIKVLAQKEPNCNFMKKLDSIITIVEKKRKEWHNRSEPFLFAGLTYRLHCK